MPNDHDGRILYLFGTNDPKVHLVTRGLLRPGDVFLDIGANYSSIGLAATEWVGTGGRVHLFEPQRAICETVSASITAARLANVDLHRVALMGRDGQMPMSRPMHHSGMATLIEYGGDRVGWETQCVEVRNISTYVEPLVRDYSFGAKVDVEGAEPVIMPWLLAQPNLRFVIFEAAREENREQLWQLVNDAGLALFGLCRKVFVSRISPIRTTQDMSAFHDLVAIRIPRSVGPIIGKISPRKLGMLLARTAARRVGV